MKIYLWLQGYNVKSIHDVNPHEHPIKECLFMNDNFTEEEFDFLTERAVMLDSNKMGWKVWELEL